MAETKFALSEVYDLLERCAYEIGALDEQMGALDDAHEAGYQPSQLVLDVRAMLVRMSQARGHIPGVPVGSVEVGYEPTAEEVLCSCTPVHRLGKPSLRALDPDCIVHGTKGSQNTER